MRSTLRATTLALLISGLGSIASAQAPIKIAFVNSQALMEAAPGRQATLDQQESAVDDERQHRCRDGAGKNHRRIDHRKATVDVFAKPSGADRGGDRG